MARFDKRKVAAVVVILLIILGLTLLVAGDRLRHYFTGPTESSLPAGVNREGVSNGELKHVAEDLHIPWEVAVLPDGELLVTERSGTLRLIGTDQQSYEIEGVEHRGEGGLLGLVLHPRFGENRFIYLYLTTRTGDGLQNRVERYRFDGRRLSDRTVIIDGIPGAANHDGGRLAFGPDNLLYITVGDAGQEARAQDKNSLAGKILRLHDDGSIPDGNPYGNAVYSYGHRNPQGLAWDEQGRLWSTEHGRSGLASGYDELNLIIKGGNYGWPLIEGSETRAMMIKPVAHSGANETWAPASLAYYNGSLFFGGLRGQTLYEAVIESEDKVSLKAHFRQEFGRLRAVTIDAAGKLYFSTSNRDGRGRERAGDDRIMTIGVEVLKQVSAAAGE